MSARIPQTFIDDLLTRVDIVELIDGYVPLRKKGTSYSACCPFHAEKTPSFHVTSTKQLYHCFGCGVGGNAISFVMAYENLDFIETLKLLASRVGIELPKTSFLTQEQPTTTSLYPLLEEVTHYFQA
jgi:DNA primase